MAAYFLPSYFQKRLLRYALSRLDFIDSDALDLDNLGFTIGQRSVIELKNVGVKVSKVVERIDLPSAIRPRHASIRTLRVTIPADLHVSGIEVEVDGVDIEIEIDQPTAQNERRAPNSRDGTAPSHKDIANRPRIASKVVHDPGGASSKTQHDLASSIILPAPEDLAASFLQAEPEREKQELRDAVESRSIRLQHAGAGLEASTSEDGMGIPEGFSLPGFVTNFFAGIADRLSVAVRHISARLYLPIDKSPATTETLELVLQIEEIELRSLQADAGAETAANSRRLIRAIGIELLIVSDGDLLAHKSNAASPQLSKSRSTASTLSRHDSRGVQFPSHGPTSSSSSSATSSGPKNLGLGVHESMLEDSQLFGPSLSRSNPASFTSSPELSRLSPIQSRDRGPSSTASSHGSDSGRSADHDLSESKLFSHDEAESMFMSAMSHASSQPGQMPGAFADSDAEAASATPRHRTSSANTLRPTLNASISKQVTSTVETPGSSTQLESIHDDQQASTGGHVVDQSPQKCVKRLIRLNEATFKVPSRSSSDAVTEISRTTLNQSAPRKAQASPRYSAAASHARLPSDQSIYGITKERNVTLSNNESYEISLGDMEISVDVSLCNALLKAATQISTSLNQPGSVQGPSNKPPIDVQMQILVKSIILNVLETVPELSMTGEQRYPTESTFSVRGEDTPILQLQMLRVAMQMAALGGKLDRKLSIHRLGLYRDSDKIVSFFDPSTLQESFVASSVMLEPHDLVLRQVGHRVDIMTKPLHIMVDLLVVDDVLSRSGGLSSLLDLGSSVASASTTKDTRPRTSTAPTRRRSVHFDDPTTRTRADSANVEGLKLNVRISALVLDLVGSQSSMQVKSSAVKLVYRPTKLRVNISSLSLRGPLIRETSTQSLLNLRFGDIQLIHMEVPQEEDLDRLLQLLAPSGHQQEQDDDIMVDTLLRQRRKGAVVRLSVQDLQVAADGLAWTQRLGKLSEEISKLSTVTKYLPEDDRPGILVFGLINKLTARGELDKQFGPLVLKSSLLEGALISVPSLMAAQISSVTLTRGQSDVLIRELIPNMQESTVMGPPTLMCRFIPDEMEPTVKLKLSNTCFEYSVPMLLAMTQLAESVAADLAKTQQPLSPRMSEFSSASSEASADFARKVKLAVNIRNSAISLRPLDSTACGLFLVHDSIIEHSSKQSTILAKVDIRKASILIIDDVARIGNEDSGLDARLFFDRSDQVQDLIKSGFVPVGSISAASADVKISEDKPNQKQIVDVELRNNLLFLETCADSTHTLMQILGGLSPPSAPSKVDKYRTEIVPLEDMLASWTGNAFVAEQGPEIGLQVDEEESTPTPSTILTQGGHDELSEALEGNGDDDDNLMHNMYDSQSGDGGGDSVASSSVLSQFIDSSVGGASMHIAPVNITAEDEPQMAGSVMMHSLIDFRDGHFMHNSATAGTAHRWDTTQNTYDMGGEKKIQQSPVRVRVRDVHIIWNLYDGYDWQNTRDVITQAVRDVEDKAYAKQRRRDSHRSPGPEDDDESVVGDVLFNSIYISIPTNRDPRELANAINLDVGDTASETGSYATSTTITAATSKRHSGPLYRPKKLKLNRSKSHKMTFELEGLGVEFFTYAAGLGNVESSIDIRVRKLEVYDHIPTSTWKKFATYMHEAGEREVGTDMVHIELVNVKPVAELAASEIVMKVTVLPLRLHVDQDALDFITRFFEFKDDRVTPSGAPSNPPFIQRAEVNPIRLRLDFKPKRIDYAGLKSGKLTEFMNFIILDRSDMVLRRVILYGVSGFDRLGIMLNNIWTPDVRNNQLPGVLAGLAPVRSLVDVGSGVRDLVAVPIREYKKDGRIVRSIQKGALAFAKTTTTELVNLGAKLAIGTQTVLQNTESVLSPHSKQQLAGVSDSDDEEHPQISHYADQPLGIIQGLKGAYAGLERDLLLAKDAIVAVPGEIMADGTATGAARVVLKQSPTIILRPAIGVTKAMGQALLGAGNTLDKGNKRRIEDVSASSSYVLLPETNLIAEIQTVLTDLNKRLRVLGTVWTGIMEYKSEWVRLAGKIDPGPGGIVPTALIKTQESDRMRAA